MLDTEVPSTCLSKGDDVSAALAIGDHDTKGMRAMKAACASSGLFRSPCGFVLESKRRALILSLSLSRKMQRLEMDLCGSECNGKMASNVRSRSWPSNARRCSYVCMGVRLLFSLCTGYLYLWLKTLCVKRLKRAPLLAHGLTDGICITLVDFSNYSRCFDFLVSICHLFGTPYRFFCRTCLSMLR